MLTGRVPRITQQSLTQRKLELAFLGLVAVLAGGAMLMFMKQEIVPLLIAIMICVFVKFIWDLVDDPLGRLVVFTVALLISFWLVNFVIDNISEEYTQIYELIPEYRSSIENKIESAHNWIEELRASDTPEDTTGLANAQAAEEAKMAQQAIATLLETSFALAGLPMMPPSISAVRMDTVNVVSLTDASEDTVASPFKDITSGMITKFADYLPDMLRGILGVLTDILSSLAAALIYAGFILGELRLLSWKVHRAFPGQGGALYTSLKTVAQGIADYFGIKTLVSLATAVATYLVLNTADVRLAFFWSVVTFFLNFVPNVGSLLALGVVGGAVFLDPTQSKLLIIALLFIIQFVFGNVVEPLIAGDTLDMSALAMLLSLAVWYRIWGVSGALLSVPITFAMKELCKLHPSLRFVTVFVEGQRNDDKILRLKRRFWRYWQYLRPTYMATMAFLTRPILGRRSVAQMDRHRFPAPVLPEIGDCIELSDGSVRILVRRRLQGDEICYDYLFCRGQKSRLETYIYRSGQRLLLRTTHWDQTIAFAFPIFAKGEQLRYEGGDGHLETFEVESGPGYAQFGDRDLPEAWQCTRYIFEGESLNKTQITLHESVPWPLREIENGIETYVVDGIIGGVRLFERRRRMNDLWERLRLRVASMFGLVSGRPALPFPDVDIARPLITSGEWTVAFVHVPRQFKTFKQGYVYPVAGSDPETLWVQIEKVEELRVREATRHTLEHSPYQSVEQLAAFKKRRTLRVKFLFLGEVPNDAMQPSDTSSP